MMTNKSLIFLLLFQFSNAGTFNRCLDQKQVINTTSLNNFEKTCKESGESKDGLLLSNLMICIPSLCKRIMHEKPRKYKNMILNLNIEMSSVEVIEIGLKTMTISMHLSITWSDPRFLLFRSTENLEKFYLSKDEQKGIWSPQIVVGTKKLLQNEIEMEFGVHRKSNQKSKKQVISVTKKVDLTTKAKCELDFELFPFDTHLCKLEVRIM